MNAKSYLCWDNVQEEEEEEEAQPAPKKKKPEEQKKRKAEEDAKESPVKKAKPEKKDKKGTSSFTGILRSLTFLFSKKLRIYWRCKEGNFGKSWWKAKEGRKIWKLGKEYNEV